ncbi:uncharacterized protein LOC129616608 [Condylostylus longicornis]|uniref:uncharacterized protein LOC129616608 n=1 Tax=Condylostylus longicornis TaxID=2530218 RepID=UPI00244E1378|nr:uncharacterized protein LOC129616608 [Condylostylus longicornis]
MTSSYHIPTVEQLTNGVILLNQHAGNITIDNEQLNTNGTYVIKFHGSSIIIDGEKFTSKELSTVQVLPAILQPQHIIKQFQEHLSLEYLKTIHINNTRQIDLLKQRNFSGPTLTLISFGPATIVITFIIIVFIIKISRKTGTIVIKNNPEISRPSPTTTENTAPLKTTTNTTSTPCKTPHSKTPKPTQRNFYRTIKL